MEKKKLLVEQVADKLWSFNPIKDALWTFLVNKVYFVAFLDLLSTTENTAPALPEMPGLELSLYFCNLCASGVV